MRPEQPDPTDPDDQPDEPVRPRIFDWPVPAMPGTPGSPAAPPLTDRVSLHLSCSTLMTQTLWLVGTYPATEPPSALLGDLTGAGWEIVSDRLPHETPDRLDPSTRRGFSASLKGAGPYGSWTPAEAGTHESDLRDLLARHGFLNVPVRGEDDEDPAEHGFPIDWA